MKLNLIIAYGSNKRTLDITANVGTGENTFKWLALMAAQRFAMEIPKGRVRHYEKQTSISGGGNIKLLPKNIYTSDCPFFHPEESINQYFKNGDCVYIDLYDEMPLDKYNNTPQFSPWTTIAFHTSSAQSQHRETLIQQKIKEVQDLIAHKAKAKEEKILQSNRPKLQLMRHIMREHLIDDDIVRTCTENEWVLIEKSGIFEGGGIGIKSDDVMGQRTIKSFFIENYIEISDMYKYYSAVNSGGGTHTLEYIEFSKFVCETGIFQAGEHSSTMMKIFVESHVSNSKKNDTKTTKKTAASIHSEIRLHEFFIALIKIATYKYITLMKKELALKKKRGHQASISTASTPTLVEALTMLHETYLKPVYAKLPIGAAVRCAFGSDDMLLLFHKHLDSLGRIFCIYADCTYNPNVFDNDNSKEHNTDESIQKDDLGGIMNLKQFSAFVTDAEFLGGGQKNDNADDAITMKNVRQIFSASQHDTTVLNNPESEDALLVQQQQKDDNIKEVDSHEKQQVERKPSSALSSEDGDHQEQMEFSEFIFAIGMFGILKHSNSRNLNKADNDEDLTHNIECVEKAVEKVVSLLSTVKK